MTAWFQRSQQVVRLSPSLAFLDIMLKNLLNLTHV